MQNASRSGVGRGCAVTVVAVDASTTVAPSGEDDEPCGADEIDGSECTAWVDDGLDVVATTADGTIDDDVRLGEVSSPFCPEIRLATPMAAATSAKVNTNRRTRRAFLPLLIPRL